MREIRIFELEYGEPVETWRLARPMRLQVSEGELWLTFDGDAGDYWLRENESIALAAGVRVHVSAGKGAGRRARFALALGGAAHAREVFPAAQGESSRGLVARVGATLREWARRGQWGVRAAG